VQLIVGIRDKTKYKDSRKALRSISYKISPLVTLKIFIPIVF